MWGLTPEEKQRWLRIRLSVAAYAYESMNTSIMSDAEFDKMCLEVDTSIDTGNEKLDKFFREHFDPNTGQWIWSHPEPSKLKHIAKTYLL